MGRLLIFTLILCTDCKHMCGLKVSQTYSTKVAVVFKALLLCQLCEGNRHKEAKSIEVENRRRGSYSTGDGGGSCWLCNCKANPPQVNPRNVFKCRGLTVPHWAKCSFTSAHLLLFVASLSWDICTYAFQGHVWICSAACFYALFCQLCGSVLIHDPGQKCMPYAPLFEYKWLHVCASSYMRESVLSSLWLLLNLS